EMLSNATKANGGKLDNIYFFGHCGGPGQEAGPGVKLGPDGPRFDADHLPDKLRDCIRDALKADGTLVFCSCGYRANPPNGMGITEWDNKLQALADQLGRRVCACPTFSERDGTTGCFCQGANRVCKDPKRGGPPPPFNVHWDFLIKPSADEVGDY